jgi:hypothetical protein
MAWLLHLDGKIDKSVSVPLQRMLERRDVALVAEKQQAGECIHQTALQGGSVAKVELAFSRSIIEGQYGSEESLAETQVSITVGLPPLRRTNGNARGNADFEVGSIVEEGGQGVPHGS